MKKYDIFGKEKGSVALSDECAEVSANRQLIKDIVIAQRANKRQWSACTKNRSEVSHSGKKPHRQKGLGRARQGSLAAAQYKGGGVVFGPRPKFNQRIRINKKERRQAMRALLSEKIKEDKIFIVDDFQLEKPKTRLLSDLFKALRLEGRTLLVAAEVKHLYYSVRNMPGVEFRVTPSVYDLMLAKNLVVAESALPQLFGEEKQ